MIKYTFFSLLIILFSCLSNDDNSINQTAIDIESQADSLTLFAEDIISTSLYERDIAISPEGNEIIYTLGDYKQNKMCLVIVKKENGKWMNPEILPFSGQYQDLEPFFSVDGNSLYFASKRPIYGDSTRDDYNIWYTERLGDSWADPIALDTVINTRGDEFFPSISKNGNLYFTAERENGIGREDIFLSRFEEGKYSTPEPLPIEINSALFEFNAYVSPLEDVLVFSSFGREDGFGGGDLYISQKDQNDRWGESVNMGKLINSDKLDFCPFIDWENQNFYFSSDRLSNEIIEFKSVNSLKDFANNTLNGFGNIYKIGIDKLGIEKSTHISSDN
jgi:hypothetical protein